MAVYDLEEQEQLDELKTWWKQYGNLVTGVLLVASLAVAGWQGWNWWQRNQAMQAGMLYSAVELAAGANDAKKVRDVTGELIEKYSGTSYAAMAALLSAKLQAEGGDRKTAQAQLGWVVEHAHDTAYRDLARLRLAGILFDEKSYDEALKHLAVEPALPFAPRFGEMRGDVLAAQGKSAEAKAAYQVALNKIDEIQKAAPPNDQRHAQYRDLLRAKLDATGGKGS